MNGRTSWAQPYEKLAAFLTVQRVPQGNHQRIIAGKFCSFSTSFHDFVNVSVPTIAGGDYVGQTNTLRISLFLRGTAENH